MMLMKINKDHLYICYTYKHVLCLFRMHIPHQKTMFKRNAKTKKVCSLLSERSWLHWSTMAEVVMFLICRREVPDSNLIRDTDSTGPVSWWLSSTNPGKFRNHISVASFHVLCKLLFTISL